MGLFDKFFSKDPQKLMNKGRRYLASEQYFDARVCFEDGLNLIPVVDSQHALASEFQNKISECNEGLALLNLSEAEHSISRNDITKAIDLLELVKSLSNNQNLREKADSLLCGLNNESVTEITQKPPVTCTSCHSNGSHGSEMHEEISVPGEGLSTHEYFDLLIHELPMAEYERYSKLGEEFAYAYVAAGKEAHADAIRLLDQWNHAGDEDIYLCEKGKILHRIGNDIDAERHLRAAISLARTNSLSWLALTQLLIDKGRIEEALSNLNTMIAENLLFEQSKLMRADIYAAYGQPEQAINEYVELLETSLKRSVAERLHEVLLQCNRNVDAARIFKIYLGKCSH